MLSLGSGPGTFRTVCKCSHHWAYWVTQDKYFLIAFECKYLFLVPGFMIGQHHWSLIKWGFLTDEPGTITSVLFQRWQMQRKIISSSKKDFVNEQTSNNTFVPYKKQQVVAKVCPECILWNINEHIQAFCNRISIMGLIRKKKNMYRIINAIDAE